MTISDQDSRQQGWKGLFTLNTSPKVKQWINITMFRFVSDWDSPFVARGQRKGISRVDYLCNTTMPWRTQHTLFRHFKHKMAFLHPPNTVPCHFRLFPQLKMALKRKIFDDIVTTKANTTKHLNSILQDAFKTVCKNGKRAGLRLQLYKDTILKGINY
jgi:hypothetical protein